MIVRTRMLRRLVKKWLKNESPSHRIDRAFDFRRFSHELDRTVSAALTLWRKHWEFAILDDSISLRTQAQNLSSFRSFSIWLSILI